MSGAAMDPVLGGTLEHPNADLVISEGIIESGGEAPPPTMAPRHRHVADDEAFYCLDGELAVEIDGVVHSVRAGGAVMVPRGAVHTWWNPSPAPLRYLILTTRRVNDLIAALHDPNDTRTVHEKFAASNAELV